MLTRQEEDRYHRQLLLPEIGAAGQERLQAARVLVVGVGGLGSPAALYLAAAGVGTLGLVEPDVVELSNLQRQVLYRHDDLGRDKVEVAAEALRSVNPHVELVTHKARLTSRLADQLVPAYDVVVDACDSIAVRLLVNDACVRAGRPMVYGAVDRLQGQAALLWTPHGPCYRCLFPAPEPAARDKADLPVGVLGTVPGLIGMVQATEVIKLVARCGEPLLGRLLVVDALTMRFQEAQVGKDAACPVCSGSP